MSALCHRKETAYVTRENSGVSSGAFATGDGMTLSISLARPAAGLTLTYSIGAPHMRLGLDFVLDQAAAARSGQDLKLAFEDGAAIVLQGYFAHHGAGALPTVVLGGNMEIPGPIFLASLDLSLLPPAPESLWMTSDPLWGTTDEDLSVHSGGGAHVDHAPGPDESSLDAPLLYAAEAIRAGNSPLFIEDMNNHYLGDVILNQPSNAAFWPSVPDDAAGPVVDVIRDFSMKSAGGWTGNSADGGDFPDLRGLLQGVRDDSLDSYLSIEQDGDSAKVCIKAEPDGHVVQTIVFEHVYTTHRDEGSVDIINELIRQHILLTSL